MREWSDKLKLGKSSAFVKRDLRILPLTEAELEADFFRDAPFSTRHHELWTGMVIEREVGALLAREDVHHRSPTVNDLATVLAHAMKRPLVSEDRQRPGTIYLRDRPQWQELLPHLHQLGIRVVLGDELPRFDEAAIEWIQRAKSAARLPSVTEIKNSLRNPFPARNKNWLEATMVMLEWTDTMLRRAYPRRNAPAPSYDPTTTVLIPLTAGDVGAILTDTEIARTKKLRPPLEAVADGGQVALSVHEWGSVCLALCGARSNVVRVRKRLLAIAVKIASRLVEALNIDAPPTWVENCR